MQYGWIWIQDKQCLGSLIPVMVWGEIVYILFLTELLFQNTPTPETKTSAQSGSSHSAFSFLCISSSLSATSLSLAACTKPRGVPSFCVCWIIQLKTNITFTMVPWCTSAPTMLRGFASVPGTFLSSAQFNAKLMLDVGPEMKVAAFAAFPLRDDLLKVWGNQACVFSFTSFMLGFFFLVLSQFWSASGNSFDSLALWVSMIKASPVPFWQSHRGSSRPCVYNGLRFCNFF